MDHKKHYDLLISTRRNMHRNKIKNDGLHKHHIIPKALGGDNSFENLVLLTPKEHFIAHLLLMMMYKNSDVRKYRKMVYAFWNMCGGRNKLKTTNSRAYLFATDSRKSLSCWVRKDDKQRYIPSCNLEEFLENDWCIGRLSHNEETKKLISDTKTGSIWVFKDELQKQIEKKDLEKHKVDGWIEGRITFTETHKTNIKNGLHGRNLPQQHKNNIGNSIRGKKIEQWSDDRKKRIAKSIIFFGVKYDGISWAAKALNKSKSWIFNKLKDEKFIDCYYL